MAGHEERVIALGVDEGCLNLKDCLSDRQEHKENNTWTAAKPWNMSLPQGPIVISSLFGLPHRIRNMNHKKVGP